MSRGDEIEEGGPRRGWQPPPGGYDDERNEPRDDDDGVGIKKTNRSGAVTAVGIVAIILASLSLLAGLCTGCVGAGLPFFQELAKQNANDPNMAKAAQDLSRIPVWFVFAESGVATIRGLGLLIGGIGVLKRSNSARMLTLGMAVFGLIAVCADTGGALAMGFMDASGSASAVAGALFSVGFAVFAFVVLLKPKNVAEFRS